MKVTVAPLTGFESLSSTETVSGAANATSTGAFWGVPPVAVIVAAAPAIFVRLKLAGAVAPVADAVTTYGPVVAFAVNADEVATPLALVISVSVAVPPVMKAPLGPDSGAVKVTVAPASGDPPEVSVATSGAANADPTVALGGVPLAAVIAMVGGAECELGLPQLIRKPKTMEVKTRTAAEAGRFIAIPLGARSSHSCPLAWSGLRQPGARAAEIRVCCAP